MAITTGTEGRVFFNTQSLFNSKALSSGLLTGGVYFVENKIYLATSASDYTLMSELRLVPTLPAANAATVEKGLIYFAADTNLLAVNITTSAPELADEWVYLNNAFVSITSDTTGVYLVKADGSSMLIPIPTVDVGAGTAGELVSANAAGELQRSGKTIADVMEDVGDAIDTAIGELEETLESVADGKIDKLPEIDTDVYPENEIILGDDEGGIKTSGKKFVTTIAKTAGAYSDDEIPTEKAVMTAVDARIEEALEGNRFRDTFTIGGGDTQITNTLVTEPIGVGDNWLVVGTPGATGTFMGVSIQVGDTIIFKNRVEAPATIQTSDFVIKPYIGADIVDSLDADQSGDAFRALSARQGWVLDGKKLDKLATGEANEIILSTTTGIKRSGLGISTSIDSETIKRHELSSWVTTAIDADFDGTTGAILATITPGTESAPWTGTVAGRTVRVWTDGSAHYVDVVLQPGDDPALFELTAESAFADVSVITTIPEGVPTSEAVADFVEEKVTAMNTELAADLSSKVDKTTTGGGGEILTADGSGGMVKSGKKIVSTINEEGLTNADEVPTVEAVIDYVQESGFRWIVD